MTYVVDASVAIKWFMREDLHEQAMRLADQSEKLHAPDWIYLEIAHAAFKKWLNGELTSGQMQYLIPGLAAAPLELHRSAELTEQALAIAVMTRHPVYDCLYIACAEAIDGVVVTADNELCRSVADSAFADRVVHLRDL